MNKTKLVIFISLLAVGVLGFLLIRKFYIGKPEKEEAPSPAPQIQPEEEEITTLPEGFDFEEKTGSELSGFFFLKDINWGGHQDYERVVLTFQPKDKSPIPFHRVSLKDNKKDPLEDAKDDVLKDLGNFRLEVYLSDTIDYDISQIPPIATYKKGTLNIQSVLVNKIKVFHPQEDNTLIILIGLNQKTPFKISSLTSPSRVVIDLKK